MRHIAALFVAASLGLASACDGGTGYRIEPLITSDTVDLAAPGSATGLPTAVDVTSTSGIIAGGRFPERQQDAEQWDLAIRVRDGQVVFVPAGALGLSSNPAVTHPLMGQSFDQVIEAPGAAAFVADSAVVVQEGAVYVVRSRVFSCGFGGAAQYAKIQPLAVSAADGTVQLRIATNEVCGDPRLVEQD